MYKYDTLNRLTSADRGDLDGAKTALTGAAVKYQDWMLDKDGNWNVIAILNADGTVQARYIYDAYGVPTVLEGDWTSDTPDDKDNELRYCGYYRDAETATGKPPLAKIYTPTTQATPTTQPSGD